MQKSLKFLLLLLKAAIFFHFFLILTGKNKKCQKGNFYAKKVKVVIFAKKKVKKYVNIFLPFFLALVITNLGSWLLPQSRSRQADFIIFSFFNLQSSFSFHYFDEFVDD